MSKKERTAEEMATFNYIRQEINSFVVLEYGFYHLKPGQNKAHWLSVMPYMPELIDVLLKKVTSILNLQTKSKNPVFMVHVITDIAYYLSEYAVKAPDSINRNQTAKALKQKLIDANAALQGRLKTTPIERKERKKVAAKKSQQLHGQVNDMFREIQNDFRHHWGR